DPALASFQTPYQGPGQPAGQPLYLHTSPEFPMKRLLAAGSGPIFQVARVFRDGEAGARHNPEFSLLEWYRTGWELEALMDEVEALVTGLYEGAQPLPTPRRYRYRALFQEYLGLDPLAVSVAELRACGERAGIRAPAGMPADDPDPWRDWLLSHLIEPRLGPGLVFVRDYPASQAALARLKPGDPAVAERFELYWDGLELANGFHELGNAAEQRARFLADNRKRRDLGLPEMPLDERLLAALEEGLPDCSGVALGLDRLLMRLAGLARIDQALSFAIDRA
ncbi:MAG: EF-P lysine aminoacylase GenX, partial [Xanthomonadaceae bacterium]|nr:EF-P lysine aminoacylase GenX [Xanthomonadaceae bacterium]